MGRLVHIQTGQVVDLSPAHTWGRAPTANTVLATSAVSSFHASVHWDGGRWMLRDLGSRNGTWVDGARLTTGHATALVKGARVVFGGQQETWEVVDLRAPGPTLTDSLGVVTVLEGTTALPDEQNPLVFLEKDRRGLWWVQRDAERTPLSTGPLTVGDRAWRVVLPTALPETTDNDALLRRSRIRFRVARGEEHIEMDVIRGEEVTPIPSRVHHYTLVTLARIRLEDRRRGMDGLDEGWTETDQLCSDLRMHRGSLYTQIFRIRKQLERLGFGALATAIIEHRRTTAQLRLGLADVEVSSTT